MFFAGIAGSPVAARDHHIMLYCASSPLIISRKVALGNKEDKVLETVNDENIDLVVLSIQKNFSLIY